MDAGEISWLEAVILGVVQGLTEFLPISSSAHILIVSQLLGWEDPGAAFTAVTQIGTEIAVLIYFRRDIVRIVRAWWLSLPSIRDRHSPAWTNVDAKMGWFVIVGSIPIVVLGLTFSHQIETAARNLYLVAVVLIVFGVVLGIADKLGEKVKTLDKLTLRDGVLFGFGQALALIPGVSRSGATITAGLALGYTREAAARYSFLLAIPAVLGSGAYEATRLNSAQSVAWGPTLLATVVAAVIGYSVIAWLLRWISTHSFTPFVVYRIALGSLVLILLSTGVLTT
jgi:undecaprenyl-diphosphatase